jgi:phosphoglycerate dehydrogenase-like enzyme
MKTIITLGIKLNDNQKERLNAVGELKELESPTSVEDLLSKTEGADVIYSNGSNLLDSLPKLKNVLVVYPFVELGSFDSKELEKNGVFVANSKGGNRDSIVEWVMYMTLSLFRKFAPKVRTTEDSSFELQESLHGKSVLVVGHGSIGTQVGVLCEAFGMDVSFFNRGDDLSSCSKDADLIINALNCNSTTQNILNENFFMNLKKGSYYITFVRPYTYDINGLIKSMDSGIVAGAAIDCDPEKFGDTKNEFYQKAMSNSNILVTPHIAFSTTEASANGKEIAIKNIEEFINGNPQNILKK